MALGGQYIVRPAAMSRARSTQRSILPTYDCCCPAISAASIPWDGTACAIGAACAIGGPGWYACATGTLATATGTLPEHVLV